MPDAHHADVLHRSRGLCVSDVRCGVADRGLGAEDAAVAHSGVLPRAGLFVRADGRRRVVGDAASALFFNRGQTYRVEHPIGGGDRCTDLSFGERTVRALLDDLGTDGAADRPFPWTHVASDARTELLHRRLVAALRGGAVDALAVEEIALTLVGRLVGAALAAAPVRRRTRSALAARRDRVLAERTRCLLADRYADALSLDDVAVTVESSPYHLCRVFRAETGATIHAYRNRLRLRAALGRVLDGAADLTRVALELGFSDHSHFTNAFRREFGVAPSALRVGGDVPALLRASRNLQA